MTARTDYTLYIFAEASFSEHGVLFTRNLQSLTPSQRLKIAKSKGGQSVDIFVRLHSQLIDGNAIDLHTH